MTLEALYTHDSKQPTTWTGRTIHPAVPQVVSEAHSLEKCRQRLREGLEAGGLKHATLVEYQGVLLGGV